MKKILLIVFYLAAIHSGRTQHADVVFPAKEDGLWGYVNSNGIWIIKPTFFKAATFSEGVAAAKDVRYWGYIDISGEWIIEPRFEQAAPFSEGLAVVVYENRWGYVDHDGDFIIEPQFTKASSFSEGLAVVAEGDHLRYIDQKGKVIVDGAFLAALPFSEGIAPVQWKNKSAFIGINGQVIISHPYKKVNPYAEGLAQVSKNRMWGYVDKSGNVAIPVQYERSTQFSEGLASVRIKEKWGYIDKTGSWSIDPKFDLALPFRFQYAVARKGEKYGIIDHSGKWLVQPQFDNLGMPGRSTSLREEIKSKIQIAFTSWRTKGEFEKSADYQIRMERSSQESAMDSIAAVVLKGYGDNLIAQSNVELGYYNADRENFNVYIPGILPTSLSIPIEDAHWVKDNWYRMQIIDTQYAITGEQFVLTAYAIRLDNLVYAHGPAISDTDMLAGNIVNWADEIVVPEIAWNTRESGDASGETRVAAKPGSSDVDHEIPINKIANENTFALIIGNEDYQSFQGGLNDEINVSYAAIDAEIFAKYVNRTLGVPKKNITLITNATAGQTRQVLAKMSKIAEAYEGNAEFIFYYAGHGLPDQTNRKPYLIPVDVEGSDLTFAVSLDEALSKFTENEHTRVTAFIDACFTGGSRYEPLVASRGVKIRPKSPFLKGNLVMFTASSENESAFAYSEKAHGMFTYFLLKKLKETNGHVTYSDLGAYLNIEVKQNAIVLNNRIQTPEVVVSPSIEKKWKTFRLTQAYTPESKSLVTKSQ